MEDFKEHLRQKLEWEFGEARRPEVGPIWLDLASRTLQMKGTSKAEHLYPQEYLTLWLLIRAYGKAELTEREIREFVMEGTRPSPGGTGSPAEDATLTNNTHQLISGLRKKLLGFTGNKVRILHRPKVGYYLEVAES